MKNRCPECHAMLSKNDRCGCGWQQELVTKTTDQRCYFQWDKERCPLVGTMSEETKNGYWLCRAHYNARHDKELSKALLEDMLKNLSQWQKSEKDWRVILLEENLKKSPRYATTKKNIEELLQELKQTILISTP